MKYILFFSPIVLYFCLSITQYFIPIYQNANLESLQVVTEVSNGYIYEYKDTFLNFLESIFAYLLFYLPLILSLIYTYKLKHVKIWEPLKITTFSYILVIAMETITAPDYQMFVPFAGSIILSVYFTAHFILIKFLQFKKK